MNTSIRILDSLISLTEQHLRELRDERAALAAQESSAPAPAKAEPAPRQRRDSVQRITAIAAFQRRGPMTSTELAQELKAIWPGDCETVRRARTCQLLSNNPGYFKKFDSLRQRGGRWYLSEQAAIENKVGENLLPPTPEPNIVHLPSPMPVAPVQPRCIVKPSAPLPRTAAKIPQRAELIVSAENDVSRLRGALLRPGLSRDEERRLQDEFTAATDKLEELRK